MTEIAEVLEAQLATQTVTKQTDYTKVARKRDRLIAKLTPRQRVHAKLAVGILDRLLNPVK